MEVFGHGAAKFLSAHDGNPSPEALAKANLVGAVRGAALEVRRGEIFIVMGLSGSGKSTLVRCLSRLIEPSWGLGGARRHRPFEGEARRADRDPAPPHGDGVPKLALLPHLNVLENVAFPLFIQGLGEQRRNERAAKVIDLVGLSGREHFYPRELSGGQQQRVGIARSLAVEPDIWFLDEPFSALDPLIRREMQSELLRLQSVLRRPSSSSPTISTRRSASRPRRHHEGRRDHPDRHAGGSRAASGNFLRRRVHARRAAREGDVGSAPDAPR
ncbi:MAG: ATP-binding cassette domain-containing protein [Hyphomicrobium sp.]